jgi:hopanoid biosynthesis associated RND transporter like protein HpnN
MSYRQSERVKTAEARHGPAGFERLSHAARFRRAATLLRPGMMLDRLIVGLAEISRRHALPVALAGLLLAVFSAVYAVTHLEVSTDTDRMFSSSLPWRQHAEILNRDFPQFNDLLVVVIDAREPEEADATAAALVDVLSRDHEHFNSVRRPDASPFLRKEGLLFLDTKQLTDLMDRTIDAQPFLGQLVADPTARGLFSALSLLGIGVTKGDVDLGPYLPSLEAFHRAMADALAGHPRALSWQALLGGNELNDLAGKYKFVLVHPKLDYGALQPGGEATKAIRQAIANLQFVKSGDARVRITGQVALADEEFATVVQGTVTGMIGSVVLITLWLFLAVQTWRLILPILATLGLGLMLTLLFASIVIGTLNLISVGFGILFIGIAVDFAIQFSVRYRERRFEYPDPAEAMRQNALRTGRQILVAATATSAGFLGFVPTDFSGVAELGLIAGGGMLIAFICTMGFLPSIVTLCRPRGEKGVVGFSWLAPLDPIFARHRLPILTVFAALAGLTVILAVWQPGLKFDSDPLHTKSPNTEAMRTLYDLMDDPLTNPYTISVIEQNVADAEEIKAKLLQLPTVLKVIDIKSFVPNDQQAKLAIIADANSILATTLLPHSPAAPVTPDQIRLAAKTALAQIDPALAKLPRDHPLAAIAADLHGLLNASDGVLLATDHALTEFLPDQLNQLRAALSAEPVTLYSIPAEFAADWLLADGRARVQVLPATQARSSQGLRQFVSDVESVAPNAGGSAVTIVATSKTIVDAFRDAALIAVASITIILLLALRRALDVGLVLAPLLLSALLTMLVAVLLPLPLNFANIIALPLLLGVGVSFNIYFVMNWRAGRRAILGSATARAIVFSALTTGTAFGSLALSEHPGTASMGELLLISLACTLLASLVFIPALLSTVHARTSR